MRDLPVELIPLLNGLPPAAQTDVRVAIETSPYLSMTLVDAARQGRVDHIAVATTAHQGGRYDAVEKTILSMRTSSRKETSAGVSTISPQRWDMKPATPISTTISTKRFGGWTPKQPTRSLRPAQVDRST